jgi:hypothetical protein
MWWKFLREHPLPGVGLVLGGLCTVGAYLIDGWHLVELRPAPQIWEGIGAAVFLVSVMGILYQWWKAQPPAALGNPHQRFPTTDWETPLELVYRQNYENETVSLDGKKFLECTFKNVTYSYQGIRPIEIIDCKILPVNGETVFTLNSRNPVVMTTMGIVRWAEVRSPMDLTMYNKDQAR